MPIVPYPADLDLTRQAVVSTQSPHVRSTSVVANLPFLYHGRNNREPPEKDNQVSLPRPVYRSVVRALLTPWSRSK